MLGLFENLTIKKYIAHFSKHKGRNYSVSKFKGENCYRKLLIDQKVLYKYKEYV